jgi:2'-5' RNA ligase
MNLAQTDMHAVVTLLDPARERDVSRIWETLAEGCRSKGILQTPIPHFSWSVAGKYDFNRLEAFLERQAAQTKPFIARTTGLGVFSGPQPTIYIPVVKDRPLLELHQDLLDGVAGLSEGLNPYYSPEFWMPHITLAGGDLDAKSLACCMELLVEQNLNWEITVDNLAIIQQSKGEVGAVRVKYSLLTC